VRHNEGEKEVLAGANTWTFDPTRTLTGGWYYPHLNILLKFTAVN